MQLLHRACGCLAIVLCLVLGLGGCWPIIGREPEFIVPEPSSSAGLPALFWIGAITLVLVEIWRIVFAVFMKREGGKEAGVYAIAAAIGSGIAIGLAFTVIGSLFEYLCAGAIGWGIPGMILVGFVCVVLSLYKIPTGAVGIGLYLAFHHPSIPAVVILPSTIAFVLRFTWMLWLPLILPNKKKKTAEAKK